MSQETTVSQPEQSTKTFFYLSNFDGIAISLRPNRLPLTVGRHINNDLIINNGCVSRYHCVFEKDDAGRVVIRDLGTRNGTVVGERVIQNDACPLEEEMFIHIGGAIFQAFRSPKDENEVLKGIYKKMNEGTINHGVCIVDICDSTGRGQVLDTIIHRLRFQMLSNVKGVLMIKNMGDGFLAIYEDPIVAFQVSLNLLNWHEDCRLRDDLPKFDFRISLDTGPTTPTHSQDRMGMAINRAARFEKTQQHDLDEPGEIYIQEQNRCLMTEDMYKCLPPGYQSYCVYAGAKAIKGFGDERYKIYQMVKMV